MTLSALFTRCVRRDYITTPDQADYAYDRVGDHLIIYFQDSDGAVDWMRNLDFPAAAYRRDGKAVWHAHRGFLTVWLTLIPRIHPLISDESIHRITIVGYSHGAALSVFCHEYVWYHRPDLRDRCLGYGFGCPRVLWGKGEQDVSARWENFTVIRNLQDIVTHVPPSLFGYRHVGQMLEIGRVGKYSAVNAHRAENIRRELLAYERESDRKHRVKVQDAVKKIAKKPL